MSFCLSFDITILVWHVSFGVAWSVIIVFIFCGMCMPDFTSIWLLYPRNMSRPWHLHPSYLSFVLALFASLESFCTLGCRYVLKGEEVFYFLGVHALQLLIRDELSFFLYPIIMIVLSLLTWFSFLCLNSLAISLSIGFTIYWKGLLSLLLS